MKSPYRTLIAALAIAIAAAGLSAQTTTALFTPGPAAIVPGYDSPGLAKAVAEYPDAFRRADRLFSDIAPGAFAPEGTRKGAAPVPVSASFMRIDAEPPVFNAMLTCDYEGEELELRVMVKDPAKFCDAIAGNLVMLWAKSVKFKFGPGKAAPAYIGSIAAEAVSPFVGLPDVYARSGSFLYPPAVLPEGRIVAGNAFMPIVLDSAQRIRAIPGRQLFDVESAVMGAFLRTTPSGTIYSMSGSSDTMLRIAPGATKPEAIRIGEKSVVYFTVLDDGSVFVPDSMYQKLARIKRGEERKTIDSFLGAYEIPSPNCVCAGPDGTLWVATSMKRVAVLDRDGKELRSIPLLLDDGSAFSPSGMSVSPDGTMWFSSYDGVYAFDKAGRPVLRMAVDAIKAAAGGSLQYLTGVCFDPETGILYITDQMGGRIHQFLDEAYAAAKGLKDEAAAALLAIAEKYPADRKRALKERAALYEKIGSPVGALGAWLDLDLLGDPAAAAKLEELAAAGELASARQLAASFRDALLSYSITKCEALYRNALIRYENYLAAKPGDGAAAAEKKALEDFYALKKGTAPAAGGGVKDLLIKGTRVDPLYPALMFWYKANPAAFVKVANAGKARIEGAKVLLSIPEYADAASESAPFSVDPGKEVEVPIKVLLNAKALGIQEDMALKALVSLSYSAKGAAGTDEARADVTIYRKTALSWKDTGRLASFVTPNEDTVSAFAHRVVAAEGGLWGAMVGPKIARAARIVDALGAYGLAYIEDPASPFSAALGKAEVVDTVRFPRDTLRYKSGDCDDTTALLASMLESVGIGTAILTTPGHVFLAFDSGEAPESRWLFSQAPYQAVEKEGRLWIPVETTIMSQGFAEAWRVAGELVAKYRDSLEFLPVAGLRSAYPALPLPASPFAVVEPAPASVDAVDSRALARLDAAVYAPLASKLEAAARAQKGRPLARSLNQLAVLRLRFGHDSDAVKDLLSALAAAPDYEPAFINLSQVYMARGDFTKAGETAKAGLAAKADSAPLKALYADALARAGKTDPGIAPGTAGGSGLAATGGSGETGRGASGGFTPSWVSE